MLVAPAFLFGLLSSWHCGVMCGPLVGSLNLNQAWYRQLLYHIFRISAYILMGAILGGIGIFFGALHIQQAISIAIGGILILGVIHVTLLDKYVSRLIFYRKIVHSMKKRISGKRTWYNHALMGFFNGLLPCGLVYTMMILAFGSQHSGHGILIMAFFGIGTMPILLLTPRTIHWIRSKFQMTFRFAYSFLSVSIGLLFILKGFHADIMTVNPLSDIRNITEWIGSCF